MMTYFLIKSTIAMLVLLAVYKLFLEREKMHKFNRFYLLGALMFSLALPFITVITYIEKTEQMTATPLVSSGPVTATVIAGQPTDYWLYIVWGLYILITLIFCIRFTLNLIHFLKKASANTKIATGKAKLILLEEKTLPHTFLNYIFVNRAEYDSNEIEKELYTHELTHVKQKHTLDILFIEALKTIFWFNPLLYFYKKAIQLNHEFLADEKVIDTTASTVYYQSLLLEKATVGKAFSIASNLTFSLTKKRFLMMTKTTSTQKAYILKLAVAPVITALLLLLCAETVAQQKSKVTPEQISRIDVNSITPKELDSLQKADPVKYNGKQSDFLKTTLTDKSTKTTVSYDKRTYPVEDNKQFSALEGVNTNDIKSLEILQLTEMEINTLKAMDPKKYNDSTLVDYIAFKASYVNQKGELVSKTSYEQRPKYQ